MAIVFEMTQTQDRYFTEVTRNGWRDKSSSNF